MLSVSQLANHLDPALAWAARRPASASRNEMERTTTTRRKMVLLCTRNPHFTKAFEARGFRVFRLEGSAEAESALRAVDFDAAILGSEVSVMEALRIVSAGSRARLFALCDDLPSRHLLESKGVVCLPVGSPPETVCAKVEEVL